VSLPIPPPQGILKKSSAHGSSFGTSKLERYDGAVGSDSDEHGDKKQRRRRERRARQRARKSSRGDDDDRYEYHCKTRRHASVADFALVCCAAILSAYGRPKQTAIRVHSTHISCMQIRQL
jgi:hypothetical protein